MAKRKKRQNTTTEDCYFEKNSTEPDYKETLILRRFLTDRGKILPASKTGVTSKNQRKLSLEVKKARYMALLPYTDKHSI